MNIHIIQHVPFEKPGFILEWIKRNGHKEKVVQISNDESLPQADKIEFLIVLGGPMSALDDASWIKEERRLIKEVVQSGKPMLGICLGAQQLAYAFDGEIIPSPKEVGWGKVYPVSEYFSRSNSHTVLHWHGEGFSLPVKAELLCQSDHWMNQGFLLKNAIGLQFHLETTQETLHDIINADASFYEGSVLQKSIDDVSNYKIPDDNRQLLFSLLNTLVNKSKTIR